MENPPQAPHPPRLCRAEPLGFPKVRRAAGLCGTPINHNQPNLPAAERGTLPMTRNNPIRSRSVPLPGFRPSIAHAMNTVLRRADLPTLPDDDVVGTLQLLDLDPATGEILQSSAFLPHLRVLDAVVCRTPTGLRAAAQAANRSLRTVVLGDHARQSLKSNAQTAGSPLDQIERPQPAPAEFLIVNRAPLPVLLPEDIAKRRWRHTAVWNDFQLPPDGAEGRVAPDELARIRTEARRLAAAMGCAESVLCLPAAILDIVKYRTT